MNKRPSSAQGYWGWLDVEIPAPQFRSPRRWALDIYEQVRIKLVSIFQDFLGFDWGVCLVVLNIAIKVCY